MIVVDVETTGVDPRRHSILSIGAVDFINPKNQFYIECKAWEGSEVFDGGGEYINSLKVNGFTLEELSDPRKPSIGEAVKKFLEWTKTCKDMTLAGHNSWFDLLFLKDSAERAGIKWDLGHRCIDLHSLCYLNYLHRGMNPPNKSGRTDINIDAALNYVGLTDEPKPHNALTGAKMEAEAFSRFLFGKSLLEEFEKYTLPDFLLKR